MSRYDKTEQIINNSSNYRELLSKKNLKKILQYKTFNFNNLKNIKDMNLDTIIHIVQPFEKIYNISYKYYGSPDYSWIICYTNQISNELEINIGQTLIIYYPLEKILELL